MYIELICDTLHNHMITYKYSRLIHNHLLEYKCISCDNFAKKNRKIWYFNSGINHNSAFFSYMNICSSSHDTPFNYFDPEFTTKMQNSCFFVHLFVVSNVKKNEK